MTFKPAIWYPIAVVLGAINLLGAGFAVGTAEPWHATVHAALALAFGLWARRLRQELGETQERLDFAERLLAGPERAESVRSPGRSNPI